ncbi:unnamed protein product [Paramecium sonneborni]|uniref:WD40-repeat-containing domain n=1 Tax=Paramecium sonneborni TaxID=65129 RepID=A0A8S1M1W1_9CILI|nr:unnamed protein product [Paramecium sonneborni]
MQQLSSEENLIEEFLQFIREYITKFSQQNNNKEDEINFNLTYDNKVEKSQSQIESGIKSELYNNLKLEDLQQVESLVEKIKMNIFPQNFLRPISIQKQPQKCQDICFNNDNSLIATTQDSKIILWKFDGKQPIKIQSLQGHDNDVACLLFSQKTQNTLISGGGLNDGKIVLWQKKEIEQPWIQINTLPQYQNGGIRCMIFSKKENFLFVGQSNGFIQIFNVMNNFQQITFYQKPKQYSNKQVFGISLNDSEQQFVTCHDANYLVLWQKNNEWQPIRTIEDPNFVSFGCRIKFVDQFIIFLDKMGYLHFLEQSSQTYQFKKKIQVDDKEQDYFNFPISYNNQKRLFVIKHNKFVHFIKRDDKNNFAKINSIMESNLKLFGKVSEDGSYLATWCQEMFKIYDLSKIN